MENECSESVKEKRMKWSKLLLESKEKTEKKSQEKSEKCWDKYPISQYEKDYQKIVSNEAFRRLQDKTQVYPLAKSDFVRTRLTHSLEVSTIAKQLGIMAFRNTRRPVEPLDIEDMRKSNTSLEELKEKRLNDIEVILSCAGLLHDLGNPPFGHVGEEIIRNWFSNNLKCYIPEPDKQGNRDISQMRNDLLNFEGNAQALRILSKDSDFDLSEPIISALIKYPTMSNQIDKSENSSSIRHKTGCYYAEKEAFKRTAESVGTDLSHSESESAEDSNAIVRHPLAYLVEAADDIAYLTADLEDAVISGLVTVDQLLKFFNDNCESLNMELADKDPFFLEKKGKNSSEYKTLYYTKQCIDELENLNSTKNDTANQYNGEKDPAKIMNQWVRYIRRWLMYVASYTFSEYYNEIMTGTYQHDLFYHNNHSLTVKLLRNAMNKFVYDASSIVETELSAQSIIYFLLDKFVPATVHLHSNLKIDKDNMTVQEQKVIHLIPASYKNDYLEFYKKYLDSKGYTEDKISKNDILKNDPELVYRRILIATDFISGMTDGYARSLYRKMMGME